MSKFGGSSVANLISIKNIKKISKNKNRKIFIFSAIGISKLINKKLTDLLIEHANGINNKKIIFSLFDNYCKMLKINNNYSNEIANSFFVFDITKNKNYLISRGEYFTTKILAKYLKIKFIPAENLIFFSDNKLNKEKTTKALKDAISFYGRFCVPGFYGSNQNGDIVLFERGGSDTTGAIISALLFAKTYENWTDVCGVFTADPATNPCAKQIPKMSYENLEKQIQKGAKVISLECIPYLKDSRTTLKIRNTFCPKGKYTIVNQ